MSLLLKEMRCPLSWSGAFYLTSLHFPSGGAVGLSLADTVHTSVINWPRGFPLGLMSEDLCLPGSKIIHHPSIVMHDILLLYWDRQRREAYDRPPAETTELGCRCITAILFLRFLCAKSRTDYKKKKKKNADTSVTGLLILRTFSEEVEDNLSLCGPSEHNDPLYCDHRRSTRCRTQRFLTRSPAGGGNICSRLLWQGVLLSSWRHPAPPHQRTLTTVRGERRAARDSWLCAAPLWPPAASSSPPQLENDLSSVLGNTEENPDLASSGSPLTAADEG